MPPDKTSMIEAWRKERGVTQERLADRLGVTVVTISRWENGHANPPQFLIDALESFENEFPRQAADSGKPNG